MGREIRKVPRGWEHPRDEKGRYQPMFAEPYIDVLHEWQRNNELWERGIHPDQKRYRADTAGYSYSDWHGERPDPRYYNPNKWTEDEACCFQIYENVSEGTPLSPVFGSLPDLCEWLIATQGYSKAYAEEFCQTGWAPTYIGPVRVDAVPDLKKKPWGLSSRSKNEKGKNRGCKRPRK